MKLTVTVTVTVTGKLRVGEDVVGAGNALEVTVRCGNSSFLVPAR